MHLLGPDRRAGQVRGWHALPLPLGGSNSSMHIAEAAAVMLDYVRRSCNVLTPA